MPEYLSPGVYVEEVNTGPRPIEGVSTSTAGFAGFTERGPTSPKLVTSWQDYSRWFGGYIEDLPNAAGRLQDIFLPYAVRGFFDNGGQRLFVARVIGAGATSGSATLGGGAIVTANGPGEWSGNILLKVVRASKNRPNSASQDWFRLLVLYYRLGIPQNLQDPTDPSIPPGPDKINPEVLEDHDNLSIVASDRNFAQTVVNSQSKLIQLNNVTGAVGDSGGFLQMSAGQHVEPQRADFLFEDINDTNNNRGFAALETIDEISILATPSEERLGLSGDIIEQCERLRDRFAVLNGPENVGDPNGVNPPPNDSTYAAVYYPFVRVFAPHTAEGDIFVPPCGHVVGVYARTDVERGVHKAPANEVVRGIVAADLPPNKRPLRYLVNKRQHDMLNPKGVNVIRDFRADGRGIRVWGARTIASDPLWRYVNVRRLFIFVEESIDEGTQWVVFEPNYELTWQAVRLTITGFLRSVWRSGALAGVTQDEAFFVKCDRTTMTQDDIDNGRLICLIGIAPVKPAEFVIFRVSQKTIEAEPS